MASKTFKGGIYPPDCKDLTAELMIEDLPPADRVIIPLVQHIGPSCKPLVKVKDHVKIGQQIAGIPADLCSPVHASISGTVKKISERDIYNGQRCISIEIENDQKNEWIKEPLNRTLEDVDANDIIEIMRKSGLVGMGGAGFPTHLKFKPPENVKIDTIIINGSECEPFLTCDYRLMIEEGEKVVFGLEAMMKAINVETGIIAIEDNKPLAIAKMQELVKDKKGISVVALKAKYPQGGEKLLIKAALNREVPSGNLPMHIGVIVNNVHTAYSLAESVRTDLPVIDRVVTISGGGINQPKNLRVRLGTLCEEVLDYCGGLDTNTKKIIASAPMTGFAQYHCKFPFEKRISGIVALTENEVDLRSESPCIRCGRCVDVCPINLVPSKLDRLARLNKYDKAREYNVMDCIECSSCAYICPAQRHLVQSIVSAKNVIRDLRNE